MLFKPSHLEEVPLCRKAQEASTWKNQRGIQSEASFPEQSWYTLLSRQSPQIERESDQST